MFRKTRAMITFNETVNAGLTKAREAISHTQNTTAIFSYVDKMPETNLLFKDLMRELADKIFGEEEVNYFNIDLDIEKISY